MLHNMIGCSSNDINGDQAMGGENDIQMNDINSGNQSF